MLAETLSLKNSWILLCHQPISAAPENKPKEQRKPKQWQKPQAWKTPETSYHSNQIQKTKKENHWIPNNTEKAMNQSISQLKTKPPPEK